MAGLPMCWMAFLWLFLEMAAGLITLENGTTFYNVDAGMVLEVYNVTSTFLKIEFAPNCQIANSSNAADFDGKIILVIWAEASSNGCQVLKDVIDQTDAIYNPEVSIITSSFTNLDEYTNYENLNEAFGEIINFFPTNITLITNETAIELSSLPSRTVITITLNASELILFYLSPSWLANRWIFCSLFTISFLYALYQVILFLDDWTELSFVCFVSGSLCSLLKTIEVGVDPFFSTMLLTRPGNAFVNYYAFFFYVVCLLTVLMAWMRIAAGTDCVTSKQVRFFRYYYIFALIFTFICLTLISLFFSLLFPGYLWGLIAVFVILALLLFTGLVIMVWLGGKILLLIHDNLKDELNRLDLLKKNTVVMLLQFEAFMVLLISILIYVIIKPSPELNTDIANLGVYAGENTGIMLGLLSAYYFFSRKAQVEEDQGNSKKKQTAPEQSEIQMKVVIVQNAAVNY